MESNNLKSMPIIVLVVLLGACFCVQCGQGICLSRALASAAGRNLLANGALPDGSIVAEHTPRQRQVRAPVRNDDDMDTVRAAGEEAPTDPSATQAPTTNTGENAGILDFLEQFYQRSREQGALERKAKTTIHLSNLMEMIDCGIMSDPEPPRTTPPPTPPPKKCSDSAKPKGPNSDPVLCNGQIDSVVQQAREQVKEMEESQRVKLESEAKETQERDARISKKLLRLNGT